MAKALCLLLLASAAMAQAFSATPINDLGTGIYLGFEGGLYENGSNTVPADHSQDGLSLLSGIVPINGKIVLLGIGMSNATYVFNSFQKSAASNSLVNHTTLAIENGAEGSAIACYWTVPFGKLSIMCPAAKGVQNEYDRVKSTVLGPAKLSESQVQVIWLYDADPNPTVSLPSTSADAYTLETYLGDIARAAKLRYPNLQMMFLTSREYAGYANTTLNPEPYAYESGFSVKWLIQAQVNQIRTGQIDPIAGDLNYQNGTAPWLVWSTYTWANGPHARSDGLIWCDGQKSSPCLGDVDVRSDGTHPDTEGSQDIADLLVNYFLSSPYAAWFRANGK